MEIFLACPPGLEPAVANEAASLGFDAVTQTPGGVTIEGGWQDVWRANLWSRTATRVLARIASFPVFHLAQLDKRSHRIPWSEVLRSDRPVRVDVTTKASKIYHAKAAQARVETALRDALGVEISADAPVRLFVRIEKNFATFSLDTSGELLHKRGFKQAVVKAPIRETMAASFLRQCGYTGTEPVLDPMCGSGTFLIEAAEIAAGLAPGRERSFAFETLATFDHDCWTALKAGGLQRQHGLHFYGSDRDPGAVRSATANAERAGLAQEITIREAPVSDLQRPDGPPGLVMVNPPYGARIGQNAPLRPLYAALGQSLRARFSGWRVGLVTTDAGLVAATGLPFAPPGPPIPHGGLKVKLWRTEAL